MRKFKIKMPFIGISTIEVLIDNVGSEKEIEEEAIEKAKDAIWDQHKGSQADSFGCYTFIEGAESYRFPDVSYKMSIEEKIED